MPSRVAVFIDGGYLIKVLEDTSLRINYERFSDELAGSASRLRTYYYDCPPFQSNQPTTEESERFGRRQRFFDALARKSRFEVRLGYLINKGLRQDGTPIFQQKGADILLVVDLLRLSFERRIEKAIIVGGDGDFCPAVQSAKDAGVSVHLYYGNTANSSYSQQLWDVCDDRSLITPDLLNRCRL